MKWIFVLDKVWIFFYIFLQSKRKKKMDEFHLNKMPSSLIFLVFTFLDIKSIVNCMLVSKGWLQSITNERIWKNLFLKFFFSCPRNIESWKKLFENRYIATKNIIPGKFTLSRSIEKKKKKNILNWKKKKIEVKKKKNQKIK